MLVCIWTLLLETLGAGAIPACGYGQAIVVPATSSIQGIAGLVGKKVAVAKASSAHNLLVAAFEEQRTGHRSSSK